MEVQVHLDIRKKVNATQSLALSSNFFTRGCRAKLTPLQGQIADLAVFPGVGCFLKSELSVQFNDWAHSGGGL